MAIFLLEIVRIKLQFSRNVYGNKIHIRAHSSNTFLSFTGANEKWNYFLFWRSIFCYDFPLGNKARKESHETSLRQIQNYQETSRNSIFDHNNCKLERIHIHCQENI